jgi:uncharacterized protein YqjF (DUF2071 family)
MNTIDDYPPLATEQVRRPVMLQGWKDLTFVHWSFDPGVVQRRLPPGLEVDTFEGRAWVGLVAFHMEDIRLPNLPPVPYLGNFPETNVRTYVRGPDGPPGVWFDSLDITRLLPVLVALGTYRLPYRWSDMSIEHLAGTVVYRAQRRWPGPRGAASKIIMKPGEPTTNLNPLDRFLTARWGLYSLFGRRNAYAPVEHAPWPLQAATLAELDDELVVAAGYPAPSGDPLVHYSPGVDVRIGLPRRIGA